MFEPVSVKEVVYKIKNSLESDFQNIAIEGDITNFTKSSAGHWYFTLSDDEASISAALFKNDTFRNPIISTLKNGDKITVYGQLSVYPKKGTFQVIVKAIKHVGKGGPKERFEFLKKKLGQEGLFDIDKKKPIPAMPKKVAIITARQGAALQDFLNIYNRRSFRMDILVVPTLVQGEAAPHSIITSIDLIERYNLNIEKHQQPVDVIVLARGGGSTEDLWPFNDEALARKIYATHIPIISAIGHQTDFTISDMVADLRCETPSSAAEILTSEQLKLDGHLQITKNRLANAIDKKIYPYQHQLRNLSPIVTIDALWSKFQKLNTIFQRANTLSQNIQRRLVYLTSKINNGLVLLNSLNPNNILKRGYSYITMEHQGKKIVINSKSSFDNIAKKAQLTVSFFDGVGSVIKE